MKYSFIITFYQNINILLHCLDCIFKYTPMDQKQMEIVVVSDNPAIKLSKKYFPVEYLPYIKILNSTINRGYAGVCNYAVKQSTGEHLLFVDSDILVQDKWFESLIYTYFETPKAGATSSTILNMADNTVLHFGISNYKIDTVKPFNLCPYHAVHNPFFSSDKTFSTLTSGCCIISRSLFNAVNGMDETLYNGYCDMDLFYKITKTKAVNKVSCDSIVYHRGGVSGTVRNYLTKDTKALFCSEWGNSQLQDGEKVLREIYGYMQSELKMRDYLVFNFSKSLFASEYLEMLRQSSCLRYIDVYEYRQTKDEPIVIEDVMSNSMQLSSYSFLYFCDNLSELKNNYYWFNSRAHSIYDIIIDRCGNMIYTSQLT